MFSVAPCYPLFFEILEAYFVNRGVINIAQIARNFVHCMCKNIMALAQSYLTKTDFAF